eukprot:TRINITY_DN3430_c0_g1_i5.p1 TRINITY_DN3430_c0_g1~~TRINITY_DN3430_c0_g1_i5.p1  ORF type:complete len:216 (+),score=36.02 TRINITY_DN3430_c0_g1_i5:543-1190(+)
MFMCGWRLEWKCDCSFGNCCPCKCCCFCCEEDKERDHIRDGKREDECECSLIGCCCPKKKVQPTPRVEYNNPPSTERETGVLSGILNVVGFGNKNNSNEISKQTQNVPQYAPATQPAIYVQPNQYPNYQQSYPPSPAVYQPVQPIQPGYGQPLPYPPQPNGYIQQPINPPAVQQPINQAPAPNPTEQKTEEKKEEKPGLFQSIQDYSGNLIKKII